MAALKSASFDKLVFKAPRQKDPQGRFLDSGRRVDITTKYRHERSLDALKNEDGKIDPDQVFGVLSDLFEESTGQRVPATTLNSDEWRASIGVVLPTGHRRSVEVGAGRGLGVVYPIVSTRTTSDGQVVPTLGPPVHPRDDDFIMSCKQSLADMVGEYSITTTTAEQLLAPPQKWEPEGAEIEWKVNWNDPASPVPSPAGSIP